MKTETIRKRMKRVLNDMESMFEKRCKGASRVEYEAHQEFFEILAP